MSGPAVELVVPKLGESITEAVIARWMKAVGEPVLHDEPVCELETDKVTVALPSPAGGVLAEQRFAVGATVAIGQVIGTVAPGEAVVATPAPPAPVESAPAPAPAVTAPPAAAAPALPLAPAPVAPPVVASPVAAEAPRPLSPAQRRAVLEGHAPVAAPAPLPASAAASAPVVAGPDEEVVVMSPLRRTIAARLVEAQHAAAILTTFNEVDMTAILELRARHQEEFTKRHGVKLGFMSFFARAAAQALHEYPGLNAELRGTSIVYKKRYDLGIAVGGGKGLVVPVVRGVDRLSFADIEKTIADLGTRAKANKLALEELLGGTFTITNGGIYGSMMSTPLLNMPQTGILGMHNIVRRPIAVGSGAGERVEIRPMMYVALSYDHRVVDGREAVQFLVSLKQKVEAPERLLFDL